MKRSIQHKGAKIRMCSACGQRAVKDDVKYLRIVRSKDGTVCVDKTYALPGRGAYVCNHRECVKKLCKTRRLSHLLRGPVPEEIYLQLQREVGLDA